MPHLHPTELGTILSVWAHPDDESYLAGGVMAAAVDNGQRVVCVSATAGEHGTDDPSAWPPQRLGRLRRWETAAAMAVLGVGDHRFLGYEDGSLTSIDPAGPVNQLTRLIRDVAPDSILTFGPDGMTFHTDHQTVSTWVGEAWRRAGRPGRLLHAAQTKDHLDAWGERFESAGIYMTEERPVGVPDDALAVAFNLTDELLDRKVAALLAMHSQTAPAVELIGASAYRALNAVEWFVPVNS